MDSMIADEYMVYDESVDTDNIKAAQEADLIEGGRYKFQVESAAGEKVDKEFFDKDETKPNPFYGKVVYNVRMRLTAKRAGTKNTDPWETLERPRTIFQRMTNASVNSWGSLSNESKFFGQMAGIAAAASPGESLKVSDVFGYFFSNAGEVHITLSPEKDDERTGKHYDARNWVRSIKAYRE